jgi:hypothetical protein
MASYEGVEWKEEIFSDAEGKQFRKLTSVQVGEPIMGKEGLHALRRIMNTMLKKEKYLTNIPESRLRPQVDMDLEVMLAQFASHSEKYELSAENLEPLGGQLASDIEASYRRGLKNKEREHIFGSFTTTETPQKQEGGSLLGIKLPKVF